MSESQHLSDAYVNMFSNDRNAWFTPVVNAAAGLTAAQAAFVPAERFNSIWGVVNHLIFWQQYALHMLKGEDFDRVAYKQHQGWPPAGNPDDDAAWFQALDSVLKINQEFSRLIAGLSQEELDSPYSPGKPNRWELIQGAMNHNSYHTCEIICIRHLQKLWLEQV